MRISSDGIDSGNDQVSLFYRGQKVPALTGDTVASALINIDERACRQTSIGDVRGVFCGMGVCNECSVVVDGEPGKLACMTPVREGMTVDLQPPAPTLAPDDRPELPELELSPDVLVIGAGPAGLAAAAAAVAAGLDVVLVDERTKLGGQYFKQPSEAYHLHEQDLDKQYRQGRELIGRVASSQIRILKGVKIWGAFSPDHILAVGEDTRWVLRPRRLLVSTGAYERGVPMPGWTLPGVMTTGAAQTLLRANQVSPGTRVLVSGNGPLNLQVAAEMVRAGVTVVGLAELANLKSPSNLSAVLQMMSTVPSLISDGLSYTATLARNRVPMLSGSSVIRFDGEGKVAQATVARIDPSGKPIPGSERVFEVDAVCVGFGFLPSNEIARSLGCKHEFDSKRGFLTVGHDSAGRTSIPQVWVVGDSGGVAGAKVARAAGVLAGVAIARDLGRDVPESLEQEKEKAERNLRRNSRFQDALWRVYEAPNLEDKLADPDTIVCRCENLSLRQITVELSDSIHTAGALKRVTRAGMGKCQGRYCGPVVTSMVARKSGNPIDEFAGFLSQVPYKPTEIALIAAAEVPLVGGAAR